MRIVVIGGRGFLGRRTVRALRREPGIDVVVAGRAPGPGELAVDLERPSTFAALAGAAVVVDATSSHAARPDALAAHCVAEGLVLVEASADRRVVERLLAAHRGRAGGAGALVLGGGLFTGLSNALARAALRGVDGADRVDVAVRMTPFSGAGAGMVDLMVDVLGVPAVRAEGGRLVDAPPVSPGPVVEFPSGPARTLRVPFPEPAMILASTGARDVSMVLGPRPAILVAAFLAMPAWLLRWAPAVRALRVYFSLLRRVLLRARASRVELVARATRGNVDRTIAVTTNDGLEAAGALLAATAIEVGRRPPRGCVVVDEVVALDAMLDRARALAAEGLVLATSAGTPAATPAHGAEVRVVR